MKIVSRSLLLSYFNYPADMFSFFCDSGRFHPAGVLGFFGLVRRRPEEWIQ